MIELYNKKKELELALNNSIWENSNYGLTYKFYNEKDLWINGNAHFYYEIVIENDRLVLKFYPNGHELFIEFKYGEILYLKDNKQQFELTLRGRIK